MSNGKAMIVPLTAELIKNISLYKITYFPEPYARSKKKAELDLVNHATKFKLKSSEDINTSKLAKKY